MLQLPKLGVTGWAHFMLRVFAIVSAIALLGVTVYMAIQYGPYDTDKIYKVSIAGACLGIVVDALGVFLLVREKETILVVGVFDFFLLILAAVGIFIIHWSNWELEGDLDIPREKWASIDPVAMGLACLFMAERVFALAFNCARCCQYGRPRGSRASRSRSRSTGVQSDQPIPLNSRKPADSSDMLGSGSGSGMGSGGGGR